MTINLYVVAILAIAVFAIGVVVGVKVAARRAARMPGPGVPGDSDESFEWRARAMHTDPEITD